MTRVLIVEDDTINMDLTSEIAGAAGFEVSKATDGIMAVEMAEKERFDLIIMDIKLPGIDGVEAAEQIKKRDEHRNVPIIVITAYIIKGDRERFLDEGFSEYVLKPVNVAKFMELLKKYKK